MKDYSLRNEKSRLIQATATSLHEHITELFENGYDQGYADALRKNAVEESDKAYQQGLEDAWEAAKKIAMMDTETTENITGYFGLFRIMENLTPMQAIEKIKSYEEYEDKHRQDTIQVGDEVMTEFGNKGIVITNVPSENGDISVWFPTATHGQLYYIKDLTKTGRHFNAIAEVLAKMRGESE